MKQERTNIPLIINLSGVTPLFNRWENDIYGPTVAPVGNQASIRHESLKRTAQHFEAGLCLNGRNIPTATLQNDC